MRTLTAKQKPRAAECIAIAYSHYSAGLNLIKSGDYSFAVAKFYYTAIFAAQASCLELSGNSKKHTYWKGQFNKHFGLGTKWVPKSYTVMLNKLSKLRDEADYGGTLSINEKQANKYELQVRKFLKKVRNNTPLLQYPEFIEGLIKKEKEILALEFDYYCPKSYIHKERIQFQIQSKKYTQRTIKSIIKSGKTSIGLIKASKPDDYVLGWNNRLGQNATAYLLFLDIDENDETKVKSALKKRKGWLFKSGNGYHFVSKEIYSSNKQWKHRLNQAAKSVQLKKLIDTKHVEFSLKRGYATLRMNTSPIKEFLPFMCWDNSK